MHDPARRRALAALAAFPLADAGAAASAGLPPAQDGFFEDGTRQRRVPWRLRLPGGEGPAAWLVYSHGLYGSREGGAVWGEAWVAAGFAVLHLQHPGSDTEALRQGGLGGLQAAASAQQLLARVADVRFALDEVARRREAREAPWQRLEAERIGLVGHSFGAQTTQAVAGQRFPAGAGGADPRPRAFIAFSPSMPRQGSATPAEVFGAIERPFLAVTGSEDGDPFGSYQGGERRARVFEGLPAGRRALLWLDGADHMSFGGGTPRRLPSIGPFRRQGSASSLEAGHHALVARLSTDWWRWHLLGDEAAAARLREPQGLGAQDRWTQG